MREILFLVHRIPYPPNKGDKIRSFHILKYLAESCRVYLGAFVDDPEDWQYLPEVRKYCAEACLLPLNPTQGKWRSLKGFITGEPLSVPYYADSHMSAWVRRIMARPSIGGVLVFSSAMSQYAEPYDGVPRLIDFVDVDSDKWRQYARNKTWPASWVYRREAAYLLRHDRRVAAKFDRSLFVSEQEANLFAELAPETADRLLPLENGVDTVYFDGLADYPNPYGPDDRVMVFTGAMDYWANVDAVAWFAHVVFPLIREHDDSVRFVIAGARPTEAVRALEAREGVTVTGAVPDMRPYLAHARMAVAPLRIARGIQNKVLEAMAMGKPVLASPAAMEGIRIDAALDTWVADQPEDWAGAALAMLRDEGAPAWSAVNRRFIERRYGWDHSLARLGDLLENL
ncbi:TIGR03087 family PEP-CTERM/XrtA system glycosyltransferase [Methylomagnum sp.]